MKCPYCGNRHGFSVPEPLCKGMPEGMGIDVPKIQQCQACEATLSPAAFRPGTKAFADAKARK